MVKSLDEVIERLQYKADNIKAKLEPSYFTECIDYLKTLPRVETEQEIRNKCINEFAEWIMYFVDGYYFKSKEEIIEAFLTKEAEKKLAEMKGE